MSRVFVEFRPDVGSAPVLGVFQRAVFAFGVATFALLAFWNVGGADAAPVPTGSVLIVSPHPDDDVLVASGVIAQSSDVTVAYLTNGESCEALYGANDSYCGVAVPNIAQIRQDEAVAAEQSLGLSEAGGDLIFFGYPNVYGGSGLSTMLNAPGVPYESPTGRSATFADRGLKDSGGNYVDYHTWRTGSPATYTGNNLIGDMTALIDDLRPDHIFTTGMFDRHLDHQAAYRVVVAAVANVHASDATYAPTLHSTIIHVVPSAYWGLWPASAGTGAQPSLAHDPVPSLDGTTGGTLKWSARESFTVPVAMQNTVLASNPKYQAINAHQSQIPLPGGSWLYTFARMDEVFWSEVLPNSSNPSAGVDDVYPDPIGAGGQLIVGGIGVLGNDVAGNLASKMTAVKLSDPAHGNLTFNTDGSFTYTHDGSASTTDVFTYRPVQNGIQGTMATVTIAVEASIGGLITVTADNAFEVFVNGVSVGSGSDWMTAGLYPTDACRRVMWLRLHATDAGGIAGLLAEVAWDGGSAVSDGSWRVSTSGPSGWADPGFDDSGVACSVDVWHLWGGSVEYERRWVPWLGRLLSGSGPRTT